MASFALPSSEGAAPLRFASRDAAFQPAAVVERGLDAMPCAVSPASCASSFRFSYVSRASAASSCAAATASEMRPEAEVMCASPNSAPSGVRADIAFAFDHGFDAHRQIGHRERRDEPERQMLEAILRVQLAGFVLIRRDARGDVLAGEAALARR